MSQIKLVSSICCLSTWQQMANLLNTLTQMLIHISPALQLNMQRTNILVLLLYHWTKEMADIYFHKVNDSKKRKLVGPSTIYSIKDISANINPIIKNHILFIHAWSGCDTTSSMYGQGKTYLMKNVKKTNQFHPYWTKFTMPVARMMLVGLVVIYPSRFLEEWVANKYL